MEAPKIPSFFKQNRHKQFEYKPLYYNERKERLEEMKKKYGGEDSKEKHSASGFRMRMSSEWRNRSPKGSRGSSVRLVLIALGLFLITYLILFN